MRWFTFGSVPALFALASITSVGLADDGSMALSDLDVRIDKALFDTITGGVNAYNRGDIAGCSRIYQGSLIAIGPFLSHRPDVQATIQKALGTMEAPASEMQKAFALRAVLDEVRAKVMTKSLWARLGGEPAVKAVVHDFVLKAATDPKVDFFRGGKYTADASGVAHLEQTLVELVSTVSGGPLKYTGRAMKPVHEGMAITEAQFGAIAADLIDVLKTYKVPSKEINELVGLIATTKKDIVEGPKPVDPTSLWMRLGGEPAVKAVVHDFVIKAANDPKVDFTRGGKYSLDAAGVAHIEQLLVEQISSVTGGPLAYSGRAMKPVHEGMGITEAQFGAIAADLVSVLKSYKVPQPMIDELIGIIATTKDAIVDTPK